MIYDLQEEARNLRASGITKNMIENERMQRVIPANEARYFGCIFDKIPNLETNPLDKYSDLQLQQLLDIILMQESENDLDMCV